MSALPLELSSDFRAAMRRLAATVSVVTCADDSGWHGMTATAITSVSSEPPALLACVNTAGTFYRRLLASTTFCINLLGVRHVGISRAFGGALKGSDRFEAGNWATDRRLPYLVDAQANLFCRTHLVTHFGTHGIFIGRIEKVRLADHGEPLVYLDRAYRAPGRLVDGASPARPVQRANLLNLRP